MRYLPLHFSLEGKRLLFVGVGRVNERRVLVLSQSPAEIVLVAPEITDRLKALADSGRLKWRRRKFEPADLEGVDFVFVAVPKNEALKIVREAKARKIPVECASDHRVGDFIFPALVCKGDIIVSISTSGRNPFLSAKLKRLVAGVVEEF